MTMSDKQGLLDIARSALEASAAEQTEVLVSADESGLTRFANNAIHQNVHKSSVGVSMRAIVGKKIGVASTDDPSEESLRDLADRALSLARHAEDLEDFVSLPEPIAATRDTDLAPVQATVDFGPEERAAAVRQMVGIAAAEGLSAAGQVMTGTDAVAVANSLGVTAYFARSAGRMRVVMQGKDSSGFAEAESDDVGALSAETLGRRAADKALLGAEPRDLPPGRYTVILEPLAVTDLLGTLAVYDLHALAHQEGRSFTSGRIGEKVCGDSISLWDDGHDPRGGRLPFDYEGVPRQRVSMIENGVLKAVPYDSYTAGREQGARNTGHALPAPNTWGPVPLNVFMNTGQYSVQDMIAATEHGVLVTRFHYTNMIHPVKTIFTGMTRDGTFLIEKGKIVGGVRNLRFTQSILEALSDVDMIGAEGEQFDYVWAPPLRIQGFEFSSATEF